MTEYGLPAASVAKLLGISPVTLYGWVNAGKFPRPELKMRRHNASAWRQSTVADWVKGGIRYGRGDWAYGWITQIRSGLPLPLRSNGI